VAISAALPLEAAGSFQYCQSFSPFIYETSSGAPGSHNQPAYQLSAKIGQCTAELLMTQQIFSAFFQGRSLPGRISKLHEPNCTDFEEDIGASSALNIVLDVRYVARVL